MIACVARGLVRLHERQSRENVRKVPPFRSRSYLLLVLGLRRLNSTASATQTSFCETALMLLTAFIRASF